jgi:hypothetical protein
MYKFKVDENSFYSGYGTDGKIEMTKTYNLDNLPICCRHDGKKWVKDEQKFKQLCIDDISNKLEYHKNMIVELESQLENL